MKYRIEGKFGWIQVLDDVVAIERKIDGYFFYFSEDMSPNGANVFYQDGTPDEVKFFEPVFD